ncbi:hypothetical protein KOW79_005493 [Hemibagrus wyckioides]|uniref:Fibronectin type-III domain-containing protein n=1 Tax=Hemibagrus wyckioides TaxID=337641 RepID=A0A9D3NZQ0_9TELE|nr:uncharacterized protein LOC131354296 [Hemibagrus wyckioides]KAG7331524.1 hypothetical protein KOW79_005493 [Hemibagrus wyckioides]
MDYVYTLLMLAVPCSVLCGHVPAPDNISVNSSHFVHLLTWEAGPGSPAGIYYRVIFRTYENGWRTVNSCVEVRYPLLCNLTDVFSNPYETYYINVTAFLGQEASVPGTSRPFRPVADTELEPPSMQASPCNNSLCVYLQSPSQRLHEVYENFHYVLNVTNENGVQLYIHKTKGLGTKKLEVVPGLQYCVSVVISEDRRPARKTPVCSSISAAVNYMDAVILVFLFLVALVITAGLCLCTLRKYFKADPPLVLISFNAPYKVQLLWPSVENLKCILLEPNTYKNVQFIEEEDQEKEDEEVAYEKLRGCEEVVLCEQISEETSSPLVRFPEIQLEHNHKPSTETYTNRNILKEKTAPGVFAPHWGVTSPQTTSQIITTHLFPLKTPIPELKKNDTNLLRYTKGDEPRHEEEEDDSDDVNFFSLTLGGGQNSEQRDEAEEEEEQMENVLKMKPEVPLFVLEPPKPAMDIQPTSSESTNKPVSYSEEEEEEDTEEEEAFSGYMMRR